MEKQYAYIQSVENTGKRTSAGTEYFQLVTERGGVYFFTASDMKKAKTRAEKNTEDQAIENIKFVNLTENPAKKDISFGQALGKLLNPLKW